MTDTTKSPVDITWHGASAIARGIYGDDSPSSVRRIRHLITQGELPFFRLGTSICLRAGAWKERVEQLEREAAQRDANPA